MNELNSLIDILKIFLSNPWLLSFGGLWVVGYMLKEHSSINNKLIPWVIVSLGAILGITLIEKSVGGAIVGLIMAYFIIGFYDHIKNTIELIKG